MTRLPRSAPVLVALAFATAGCASTPSPSVDVPCPAPEIDESQIYGLPEAFDPASLEGRWRLTAVASSGVETHRLAAAPMVLVPSPDSLYVHPFCLEGSGCATEYPLRGFLERPLGLDLSVAIDPMSPDPEAPGIVLEWSPDRREAVLVFGNPPVGGRLALDTGSYFSILAATTERLTGYWNGGGLAVFVAPDGRNMGALGGWFCAEKVG